jgi:branched-chain amino acid transport system substrate-binding protein
MKRLWSALLVGLLIVALSIGCTKKEKPAEEKASAEGKPAVISAAEATSYRIGVAAPFTGQYSEYGDMVYDGAKLMVDKVNEAGGINGKPVELVKGDELCDPKEAAMIAQKFVADKTIVAVLGHLCSTATLAAQTYYDKAGLVEFSPTSTAVSVGEGSTWTFRSVYRDDFQGEFLAEYAKKTLGLKTVAIFYENNDYGIGLKKAFEEKGKKIGLEITASEAYTSQDTDYMSQLVKIKDSNPDVLFIAGLYNEGALIASQARQLGIKSAIMGGDGIGSPGYIKNAGAAAEGTFITQPFLLDAAVGKAKEFGDDFSAKFKKDPDWMAATSYDAAGILIEAIKNSNGTRAGIKESLTKMNSRATGFSGVTGITYFDKNGDCYKPVYVMTVKDGKFVAAQKQMLD